jgi:uncharacterized protein YndB with AHSA1/START domain
MFRGAAILGSRKRLGLEARTALGASPGRRCRTLDLVGEVIESHPPRRLVLTRSEPADEANRDEQSRVIFELEPIEDMVRSTVTHAALAAGSDMLRKISAGWPRVLSSLKSQLETGKPLPTRAG